MTRVIYNRLNVILKNIENHVKLRNYTMSSCHFIILLHNIPIHNSVRKVNAVFQQSDFFCFFLCVVDKY